jgi:hypothetical protein
VKRYPRSIVAGSAQSPLFGRTVTFFAPDADAKCMDPRRLAIFVPHLVADPLTRRFVLDLAETVKQIRHKELHSIVLILPEGAARESPCQTILKQMGLTVETRAPMDHSPSAVLMVMSQYCRTCKCDGIVVLPESAIAPNTFADLYEVAAKEPALVIVASRSSLDLRCDAGDSVPTTADDAFLQFFETSPRLPRWCRTPFPASGCVLIKRGFLCDLPTTQIPNMGTYGGMWWALSAFADERGLLVGKVNSAYHFLDLQSAGKCGALTDQRDLETLRRDLPGFDSLESTYFTGPEVSLERFRTRTANLSSRPPRLLLDMTDLEPKGDARVDLWRGMAAAITSRRDVACTIVVPEGMERSYDLAETVPQVRIVGPDGADHHDFVLRFGAPKTLSQLEAVSSHGTYVTTLVQELPRGRSESAVFDLAARSLSGFLYLGSEIERVVRDRFPSIGEAPSLSLLPSTYAKEFQLISSASSRGANDASILVLGSQRQPAHLEGTAARIADGAPSARVRAWGQFDKAGKGNLELLDVRAVATLKEFSRTVAQSSVVVFPWLDGGLGFQMVRCLSLGCAVVTVHDRFARELYDNWVGPGAVSFCDGLDEMVEKIRLLSEPAHRFNFLKNAALGRRASTSWRWQKIGALLWDFFDAVRDADRDQLQACDRVSLLSSVISAFHDDRHQIAAKAEAESHLLREELRMRDQKIKELNAANTLIVSSKGYQLTKAASSAIELIPGLRNLRGR